MVSPEERLLIGLKVLERLRPELRARREGFPPYEEAGDWHTTGEEVGADDFYIPDQPGLSALQDVLSQAGPLPPYSLLLGACEDGLPFLLDLNNPAPGSLLVAGDRSSGKTRLLRAILSSAVMLNSPSEVAFNVIAARPDEYTGLEQEDHCEGIFAASDPCLDNFIVALSYLVEERRRSGSFGPAMVLVVDDLAELLQYISRRAFGRLFSIVQHGPSQRVWVAAAISSEQAGAVDGLLSGFRTRLVGSIASPDLAEAFCGEGQALATELEPGSQFIAPFGSEWIHFWVCPAD